MKNGEKRPCDARIPGGWPELVTFWATEDDSRHRERILMEHSLLMKVVERKSLERFRQALDQPHADWRFHLDSGIGYDLDHLQAEMVRAFGSRDDTGTASRNDLFAHIAPLHDRTLEALGKARRAARHGGSANGRTDARQALHDST